MHRFPAQSLLICCCLALFLSSPPLCAEAIFTLKEALQRARQGNLSLKTAQEQIHVSQGQVIQAHEFPNPQASATISQVPFHGSFSDTARDYIIQQTIPIFGKRSLQKKAAESTLHSKEADYQINELDVERQVKEAYWDYTSAYKELIFQKENLKFSQNFLSRVEDNFQTSQATLADVSRSKVEVYQAANDVFEAEKNLADAKARLNRLMGQEVEAPLGPPQDLNETSVSLDEKRFLELALENRPELKSLKQLEKGDEAQIKLANRLLWAPDLQGQALYQQGERADGRESWGAGLGLTLPVWSQYKGERKVARSSLNSVLSQEEDTRSQIALEVHQSILSLKLSQDQVRLWIRSIDQSTEAARVAEERYLEGDIDLSVFLQARHDLVNATVKYVDVLRDYQTNIANLEKAVGVPLTENL